MVTHSPARPDEPRRETIGGYPVGGTAAPGTETLDKVVVAPLKRHGRIRGNLRRFVLLERSRHTR